MTNIWFTSDLHLRHRNVAYQRRYGQWPEDRSLVTPEDVEWHDAMLAEKWDSMVGKEDTVWVLGDLTLGAISHGTREEPALDWVNLRPGFKHLVLGNHDQAHPIHSNGYKHLWRYIRVFNSVQTMAKRKIGGQEVLLSHFPYTGDSDGKEDRASQWRLRNEGMPLLHGHTHSKDKVTWAPPPGLDLMDEVNAIHFDGRVQQIHVGVDAHDFAPVSLDEIAKLL